MTQPASQADVLVVAVTMETFLFTALTLVLTLGDVRNRVPNLPVRPLTLGWIAVYLVALVGAGALAAWWGAMAHPWPGGVIRSVEAITVAIGIVALPPFAWVVVRGMESKP